MTAPDLERRLHRMAELLEQAGDEITRLAAMVDGVFDLGTKKSDTRLRKKINRELDRYRKSRWPRVSRNAQGGE